MAVDHDGDNVAFELWAKSDPYHPLWRHLLDTAAVGEKLIECLGGVDDLPEPWTLFLIAMHDIGKVDPKFQNQNAEQTRRLASLGLDLPEHRERFRHERRSHEWLLDCLQDNYGWDKRSARIVTSAVRGHHGDFQAGTRNDFYIEEPGNGSYEAWKCYRAVLAETIAGIVGIASDAPPPCFSDANATGVKLAGLIVLADWIASNKELFQFTTLDKDLAPCEYWQCARKEAEKAIIRLQLPTVKQADGACPCFQDVWPTFTDLKPSQQALDSLCRNGVPPGLVIIEAPMGEGKTESAIFLAEYWRSVYGTPGTYIALPTMATSNQMHSRYREFLVNRRPEAAGPRLVHGMAWLLDEAAPESTADTYGEDPEDESLLALDWFSPSKRALIAPEAVGTVDQALRAALNVRHGFLRLLGLSAKVLIIDEVHAYDAYMTKIMEQLLKWCRALRVPVIMLSATLSRPQKEKLVKAYGGQLPESTGFEPYPLITHVPLEDGAVVTTMPVHGQHSRKVAIERHWRLLNDAKGTAALAKELVKAGGCLCVLVNTVKQAQAIYDELDDPDSDEELYLFHARFPAWRRSEIENQIVELFGKEGVEKGKRPKKAVLVATQVVEQSMDLDFDVMISQLAPIDLLLQRTGRLWRHKNTPRPQGCEGPVLHVLLPDPLEKALGETENVYHMAILLRTITLLEGKNEFDLPCDFRPLIDRCYGDENVLGELVAEHEQALADQMRDVELQHQESQALLYLIPDPCAKEFKMAQLPLCYHDDESRTGSFLHPQTRLGDRTRPAMLLEEEDLLEAAGRTIFPGKEMAKRLFQHKVDIPKWWLDGAAPQSGFEPWYDGPKWLRGTAVVPVKNGEWRGTRDGKPVVLAVDSFRGVSIKEG